MTSCGPSGAAAQAHTALISFNGGHAGLGVRLNKGNLAIFLCHDIGQANRIFNHNYCGMGKKVWPYHAKQRSPGLPPAPFG